MAADLLTFQWPPSAYRPVLHVHILHVQHATHVRTHVRTHARTHAHVGRYYKSTVFGGVGSGSDGIDQRCGSFDMSYVRSSSLNQGLWTLKLRQISMQ